MFDLIAQVSLDVPKDQPVLAIAAFTLVSVGGILVAFTKFMKGQIDPVKADFEKRITALEAAVSLGHQGALEAIDILPITDANKLAREKMIAVAKTLGGVR